MLLPETLDFLPASLAITLGHWGALTRNPVLARAPQSLAKQPSIPLAGPSKWRQTSRASGAPSSLHRFARRLHVHDLPCGKARKRGDSLQRGMGQGISRAPQTPGAMSSSSRYASGLAEAGNAASS